MEGLFEGWRSSPIFDCGVTLWKSIPSSTLWSVWKESNDRVFKGTSMGVRDVSHLALVGIAEWVSCLDEFDGLRMDGVWSSWKASLFGGAPNLRKEVFWVPPITRVLKFNVDGVARDRPGRQELARCSIIETVSSKSMGCMDSNEAEVVAILEALQSFFPSFHSKPAVESYSSNAISWVSIKVLPPWRLQFYFNEIKTLSSLVIVEFHHVGRSANSSLILWQSKG